MVDQKRSMRKKTTSKQKLGRVEDVMVDADRQVHLKQERKQVTGSSLVTHLTNIFDTNIIDCTM